MKADFKLILTEEDQQHIERARRSVGMVYLSLPKPASNATAIASVRALIMHYNRSEMNADGLLISLTKLTHMYPNMANEYIVTYDTGVWLELTPLSLLWRKYNDPFKGFGTWNDEELDGVMYALSMPKLKNFPAIIHVPSAVRLLSAYGAQEAAAAKLGADELPERIEPEMVERNGLKVPNFQAIARRAEKLNQRGDSRTNCYRCSAPKPRKCECAVCGYMPRAAANG